MSTHLVYFLATSGGRRSDGFGWHRHRLREVDRRQVNECRALYLRYETERARAYRFKPGTDERLRFLREARFWLNQWFEAVETMQQAETMWQTWERKA
jgi:hypothetical protein